MVCGNPRFGSPGTLDYKISAPPSVTSTLVFIAQRRVEGVPLAADLAGSSRARRIHSESNQNHSPLTSFQVSCGQLPSASCHHQPVALSRQPGMIASRFFQTSLPS